MPERDVTTTRIDDDTIEVAVEAHRSLRTLLKEIGTMALVAAVLAAFVAAGTRAATQFVHRVRGGGGGVFWLVAGSLFCVMLAAGAIESLRRYFGRTTFRITPEHLDVSVISRIGKPWRREWRRGAIFEIRPGGSPRALQIRLRRDMPCSLLLGFSREQIEEAAAQVNGALTAIPPIAHVEAMASTGLTYEVPGKRYEIEITPNTDGQGVVVTVPLLEGTIASQGIGRFVLIGPAVFCVGGMFLVQRQFPSIRSPCPLLLVMVIPCFVLVIVLTRLLNKWWGGQPLTIVVTSAHVHIDHPAWLRRERSWRRESVSDVFVEAQKGKNKQPIAYFVRMTAGGRRRITFCHGRDVIEMKRAVVALREAIGLAPLPDSAFPAEV